MIKQHVLKFLLGILILSSCNMSDEAQELGDGYTYVREGGELNYIIGSHTVYPTVVAYDYDNSFIVIAQEPDLRSYRGMLVFDLGISEAKADSLLQNDPSHQAVFRRKRNFWIIRKGKNDLYGPYDFQQFNQQRKRMGVSLTLAAQ
jgi:hypothetical protein